MKTLSLIVFVLSFTFTTPVMAMDKDGRYMAAGYSCGEWVEIRKEDGWWSTVLENWIDGYVSAYNTQTPDVYHILGSTDKESVYLWMDKYCQDNPLNELPNGMLELTIELWPNRKRTQDD